MIDRAMRDTAAALLPATACYLPLLSDGVHERATCIDQFDTSPQRSISLLGHDIVQHLVQHTPED